MSNEMPTMTIEAIAFRGEHGTPPGNQTFHSRHTALSFGSLETAKTYATSPNNRQDRVQAPRLFKVHLTIEKPVMNDQNDPFIDFSIIKEALGFDKSLQIARDLEEHLMNTGNFLEMLEDHRVTSLAELEGILEDKILDGLYVDAYAVFDSDTYVKWFREAGYDGAVHGGNGVSAMEAEYKVFDAKNVRILRTVDLGRSVEPALAV